MPDSGPYSLLILSFTVFSFVVWQLRDRGDVAALGFVAAFLMLSAAGRLLVGTLVNIALTEGSLDLAVGDALLAAFFLVLLTWTALTVLPLAATADPALE